MCGIAGYYSTSRSYSESELRSMVNILVHRGPDANGIFQEKMVGLGHSRLSIIDLSERANQPMSSACGRYVIVMNGEIYNYKELAGELAMRLRTTSDTEVMVEAFALLGPDFIRKVNGMFSMAIYDRQEENLFLYRDRIGIKPIFYYKKGSDVLFGSELKSILAVEKIKATLKINPDFITPFLHLGYIPEPMTCWDNIYKFPAGTYAKISSDGITFYKYWDVNRTITSDIIEDEADAKCHLKALLESSVKYRLMSDVPFGVFLSGGVDSSTVAAIAQNLSNKPISTFSIGFGDSKFDESGYAAKVAEALKTDHHEYIVTEKDAISLMPEMLSIFDEPFADSSAIPMMMVSKLAREKVKMVLCGDGGDELFMGYGSYRWAKRLSYPLVSVLGKPVSLGMKMLPGKYKRVADMLRVERRNSLRSHIFSQEQYFYTIAELRAMLNSEFFVIPKEDLYDDFIARGLTVKEKQAYYDLNNYLKDDLLVKVDRSTMNYSLEARVPILDYRIVEYALNLAENLKVKNGTEKYLLKKVLYDYLPDSLFDRPKWGFSIPLGKWLKGELNGMIQECFAQDAPVFNIVNRFYAEQVLQKFNSGSHDYLYNRIWLLIVLNSWLKHNL